MSNLQNTYQKRSGWWCLLLLPLHIVPIIFLIAAAAQVAFVGGDVDSYEPDWLLVSLSLPWLFFWVVALMLYRQHGSIYGPVPNAQISLSSIVLGVLFVGMSIGIYYSVYELLRPFMPEGLASYTFDDTQIISPDMPAWIIVATLLGIVVVAPFVEEIIFRGMALFGMAKKLGFWPAAVISSLLFGLLHGDIIGAFIFAMLLCYITWQAQTLWPAIIAHFVNNLLAGVGMLLMMGEPVEYDVVEPWIGGIIMLVSLVGAFWLSYRITKKTAKQANA
ncbi:CPBP family intramembrane glutamic endopeptidase [Salinibius halmophilus]|uniref:CPBP family intramembrane glutamic endopeptidase n=1 Tax=Salinibius halmophilus TaxID=1853216 RepID=UPI000E671BC9|nr:type II CAAX endopeptidase family protein [Salinibius halmophilus]